MNRLLVLACLGLIVHQGCCQTNQMLQQYLTMQALSGGGSTGAAMMGGMPGMPGAAGAANFMETMREQPALMRMFLQSQRSSAPAGTGGVPSTTGTSGSTGGFPSTGRSFDPIVMAVMSGQGNSISNEHQFLFQSLASGTDMRGRPSNLHQNLANALGNSGSGISKDQQQALLVKAFQEGHLNRLLDATTNLQDQMDLERRGLPGVAANQQMQLLMCPMNMRCGFQYCQDYETPYTPESFYNCQGCPRCRMETGGLNVLRSLRSRTNNPYGRMAAIRHLSQNQGTTNPIVAQLMASSLNTNYNNVPVAPMPGIQYQPPPPVRNNPGQQQQGYQRPPGSYPPQQGPPTAQQGFPSQQGPPPAQQGYIPQQGPPPAQGYPPQRGPPPAQGYPPQQGPSPPQQGYPPQQAPPQTRQGYPPQQGPPQTAQVYQPRQGSPSQYQPGQGPPPGYAPPPPNYATRPTQPQPGPPPPGYAPPPPNYATRPTQPQPGPPPRQQKPSRGPPPPGPKPTSEFINAIKNMGQTMARQQKAQNPKAAARSSA